MKKIIGILAFALILTGCSLGEKLTNTPTKKVEEFLSKYQTLNEDVLADLDDVIAEEENFDTDQRVKYREIMKKGYQDLTYEVKDETIDGDTAKVTVEIEVIDYAKVIKEAELYAEANQDKFQENGIYSIKKYTDYRLEKLSAATDKVKYTIVFTLTKKDDKWVVNNLSGTDLEKINGIYKY